MAGRQTTPDEWPVSDVESERLEQLRREQREAAAAPDESQATANPSLGLDALAPSDNPQSPDETSGPGGRPLPEGSRPMEEEPSGEDNDDLDANERDGDSEGPGDSEEDRQETLSQSLSQAALAQETNGGGGLASGDAEGAASTQLSKANHVLFQAETDVLLPFDLSTFGISLILTIPARLVIAAFLAFQLRKAVNGEKGGWFNLTWESFMLPGADMSVPLPQTVLYVAVVAYLFTVVFMALVLGGFLGLVLMAFAGQADMLGQTFSFFRGLLGI